MKLNENPIFLTQKRLVHRGGVLAAILFALLTGFSLLSGLIAYRAIPKDFGLFYSTQDAGKMFYGWTIGIEALILVFAAFNRICRALSNERKSGLWDSNRLTPLKPCQLVIGYWLGSALREFYMASTLAGTGLIIVVLAGLPLKIWLGTQILVLCSALFFGLIAVLVGSTVQRAQADLIFIALFFVLASFSFAAPRFVVTDFILPVYGIVNLFTTGYHPGGVYDSLNEWHDWPQIFGLSVHPILLSIGLQLIIGIFLWRTAIRKTANPFRPSMLRWETVAIFVTLLVTQHGLVWGLWHGKYPTPFAHYSTLLDGGSNSYPDLPLLPMIHGGTILLIIITLIFSSPQPETVRLSILRFDVKNLAAIFLRSSVSLALILSILAAAVLFLQFEQAFADSWKIFTITVGNLLTFSLIFSLTFESCRLRHKRRALGFVALWLFVLCVLPFILAGVFINPAFVKLSLLSPGIIALVGPDDENLNCLLGIVAGHFGIVLLLFIGWLREWRKLLAKTAPAQN